jgi:hypothetical protein
MTLRPIRRADRHGFIQKQPEPCMLLFSLPKLRWIAITLSCLSWAACIPANLCSQEFRIQSQVYTSESTLPVSHNLTLFSEKLICDFRMTEEVDAKPQESIVYDPRQRLFVLLDPQRKVRVEIPDIQLLKLVDGMRRETLQNDRAKFLINDTFEEDTEWSDGWVTLTSPNLTYRFKGEQPAEVSILPRYFDFLDSFTRLNASDPTKIPPFPRMRLNQTIKKLGWIPTEVQISTEPNGFFRQPINANSKHVLTSGLTTRDQELIADAKRQWVQFSAVDLAEYRGISKRPNDPITVAKESTKKFWEKEKTIEANVDLETR